MEMLGSPSTSSAFTSRRVPTPWQSGQAPNGELKENCRGSSSGKERPHTGQANRSEKTVDDCPPAPPPPRPPAFTPPPSPAAPLPPVFPSPPDSVGSLQRRLDRIVQPGAIGGPNHEPVYHDRDI